MDVDKINIADFIDDIRRFECIWNYNSELYCDRFNKTKAWMTLCDKYVKGFNGKSPGERNTIVLSLQKKWKVLRDGYTRYNNKVRKSPAKRIKQYIYFKQLSFLQPLVEGRNSTTDSADESESTSTIADSEHKENYIDPLYLNQTDAASTKDLKDAIGESDEDKLFILSLYGDFRTIAEEYKLDAKIELMNVLKKYKDMPTFHASSWNPYGSYQPTTVPMRTVKRVETGTAQHQHQQPQHNMVVVPEKCNVWSPGSFGGSDDVVPNGTQK